MRTRVWIVSVALVLAPILAPGAAPDRRLNVAFLVWDGMELIESIGPAHVFAFAPGMDEYVVSKTTDPIRTEFVAIVPVYSLADCPEPDVIVIPGGAIWRTPMIDEAYRAWLREHVPSATLTLSVCNAAILLAADALESGNALALRILRQVLHDPRIVANELAKQARDVLRRNPTTGRESWSTTTSPASAWWSMGRSSMGTAPQWRALRSTPIRPTPTASTRSRLRWTSRTRACLSSSPPKTTAVSSWPPCAPARTPSGPTSKGMRCSSPPMSISPWRPLVSRSGRFS